MTRLWFWKAVFLTMLLALGAVLASAVALLLFVILAPLHLWLPLAAGAWFFVLGVAALLYVALFWAGLEVIRYEARD